MGRTSSVVWIGDFEAQGNPSFVGADAAAPLFFRIADALNLQSPDEIVKPPEPPPGVSQVAVCAESGDLPNKYCPQTVETWYIPGKSPIRVSQLHRAVTIDIARGVQPARPIAPELNPPGGLRILAVRYDEAIPRSRHAPPQCTRHPDCAVDETSGIPRIATPLRGVTYTLRTGPRQKPSRSKPAPKRTWIAFSGSTAQP